MTSTDAPSQDPYRATLLAAIGFGLIAILGIAPLVWEPRPIEFIDAAISSLERWVREYTVALLMAGAIGVRAWHDRREDPWAVVLALWFGVVAGLLVACHWFIVDSDAWHAKWQGELYLHILNPAQDPQLHRPPHQYRWLPYGLVRSVELLTGDWQFSWLVYRWFFNYWFVWAWYRFARVFLDARQALLTLSVLVVYYPASVLRYWGQLTDPLSHALFVLALLYIVEGRWGRLAAALFLGVLAKETVVLLVPVTLAVHWREGWVTWWRSAVLGLVCVSAFLVARLPLGWRPGGGSINGVEGLMWSTNLGLYQLGVGRKLASTYVPLYENYLHVLGFTVPFLPLIAWRWRRTDARLKAIFLTLAPLLLASNVCWGWLYESRNYVPLLPVLATMSLPALIGPRSQETAR